MNTLSDASGRSNVRHHAGSWTRTSHEKVSFWLEPDELATEVDTSADTDVDDVTETHGGPPPVPSRRHAAQLADELPTVTVERPSFLDDAPPTQPDVRRVISVLRRRAGVTGRPYPQSPQDAVNRSATTPMVAPQRHVLHRQVKVERAPAPVRAQSVPAPIQRVPQQAVIQRGPVSLNVEDAIPVIDTPTLAPQALEPRVPWVDPTTGEYGWWLAGVALGGLFGAAVSVLALTAAVIY